MLCWFWPAPKTCTSNSIVATSSSWVWVKKGYPKQPIGKRKSKNQNLWCLVFFDPQPLENHAFCCETVLQTDPQTLNMFALFACQVLAVVLQNSSTWIHVNTCAECTAAIKHFLSLSLCIALRLASACGFVFCPIRGTGIRLILQAKGPKGTLGLGGPWILKSDWPRKHWVCKCFQHPAKQVNKVIKQNGSEWGMASSLYANISYTAFVSFNIFATCDRLCHSAIRHFATTAPRLLTRT